jgi:hypothetical protein
MANFLAPATVTAALQRLLQAAAKEAVSGAKAVVERPDATKSGPVVGIFLYEVVPNAALRNEMLPSRASDGSLRARTLTAVDLRYLLTFHGDEKELEPLRMLGSVLRALAAQPVITKSLVEAVVAAGSDEPPTHPWVAASDLAADTELPRLTAHTVDLEQMSHLWSLFPQAVYALSSVWQVGPVVVESAVTPTPAAPVLAAELAVSPLTRPVVTRVEPVDPAAGALTAGSTWRIVGAALAGPSTEVRVAGADVAVQLRSDAELRVDASPASALRAGRVLVEVVHRALAGAPATPRAEIARARHPVDVSARLESLAHAAGRITVTPDVPVRSRQHTALALLDPATGDVVLRTVLTVQPADAASLDVPVPGAAPGTYAAVLSVDGVDSVLRRDAAGAITGPLVEVT